MRKKTLNQRGEIYIMDLLNLAPTKVSKDLKSKIVFFYGAPKTGKTTMASKFPKALIAATEVGTNALNNVFVQPIQKWSDMTKLLRELKKDAVKEKFETVVIDTADNLYDLAEEYVLSSHGVAKIGDIPFGGGYKATEKLFDKALREVPMMGYGLVIISHAEDKTITTETGEEFQQIQPTLPKKPQKVVNRMADIIGYSATVKNEDGEDETRLIMRGNQRVVAGSRWKHTPNSIKFTYTNLVEAIHDAVEKASNEDGVEAIEEQVNHYDNSEEATFEEIQSKLTELGQAYYNADRLEEFTGKMEDTFGEDVKVNLLEEKHKEAAIVVLDELTAQFEEA